MKTASLRNLFVKNAFANVLGGGVAAIFNLILPALAVRHLGKLEFSVWNLAIQVLVYLQVFGFGLQVAITRHIAMSEASGDHADQRKTLKAASVLALSFVGLGLVAVALLVSLYPLLFSSVPSEMVTEFRISLAMLGISAVWQLFALVPMGLFTGLQRNIVPIGGQVVTRALSLLAVWIVLQQGAGLLMLSLTLAVAGALIVPINFYAAWKWAGGLMKQWGELDRGRLRELFSYCAGIAVWNVSMLFVHGVDMMIVGHFDFNRVAAYSLASTAVLILVGVLQALMSPLVATGAKLHAQSESRAGLPGLLNKTTFFSVMLVGVGVIILAIYGKVLLRVWVSSTYVDEVYPILMILCIANLVRNTAMPYALLLMATGLQKKVMLTAFVESAVNLVAALCLVRQYGAIGVAYGTLIGAVAAVITNWVFNFPRTRAITPDIFGYLSRAIFAPCLLLFVIGGSIYPFL